MHKDNEMCLIIINRLEALLIGERASLLWGEMLRTEEQILKHAFP